MVVETSELKRVKTVAHEKDVTVQAVYRWIANGVLKFVDIDGIKFVIDGKKEEPCRR